MTDVVPTDPPTPLPIPVGVRWLHALCRLGRLVADSPADPDAHPDAIPVAGTVSVRLAPERVIWQESDGRWRSLDVSELAYQVRSDGELVDAEGRAGFWFPDPLSEGVEPHGYTVSFIVKPTGGKQWTVTLGGLLQLPAEIDLVRMSSVAPATGVPNIEARLAALEALSGEEGMRFPTAITVPDPAAPRDATIHWSDGSTSGLLLPEGAPGHTPVLSWDGTHLVIDGVRGPDLRGLQGLSAYEVAVANGYGGSEAEWLESLHGTDGVSPDPPAISWEGDRLRVGDALSGPLTGPSGATSALRSTGLRSLKPVLTSVEFTVPAWDWTIIREGNTVTMNATFRVAETHTFASASSGVDTGFALPSGFRVKSAVYHQLTSGTLAVHGRLFNQPNLTLRIAASQAGATLTLLTSWVTDDPWPTVLPGSPA